MKNEEENNLKSVYHPFSGCQAASCSDKIRLLFAKGVQNAAILTFKYLFEYIKYIYIIYHLIPRKKECMWCRGEGEGNLNILPLGRRDWLQHVLVYIQYWGWTVFRSEDNSISLNFTTFESPLKHVERERKTKSETLTTSSRLSNP